MKKALIALAIVIVVGVIIYSNVKQKNVKAVDVQTGRIELRQIQEKVSASGQIQPVVQVNISANVAGEITKLYVREGDVVKAGQLLFQLDKVRYEADVRSYKSIYNSRKASLEKVQKDLKRYEGLYNTNNISQADLEDLQTQYRLAVSNMDQAEAGLNQATDNLSKTTVRAPISGTVISLRKEVGEIALGSQFSQDVIMIMADLKHMEVEVEVNENDVVRVSPKDKVDIEIDAIPDTVFRGQVSEIAHLASSSGLGTQNAVTNFKVLVDMLEIPDEMRPGMSATVEIMTNERDSAVAVPIQCVTIRSEEEVYGKKTDTLDVKDDAVVPGKKQMVEVVFRVDADTVTAVPVKLGISSEDYFEVLSGLKADDMVVMGPHKVLSRELKTGTVVKTGGNGPEKK